MKTHEEIDDGDLTMVTGWGNIFVSIKMFKHSSMNIKKCFTPVFGISGPLLEHKSFYIEKD